MTNYTDLLNKMTVRKFAELLVNPVEYKDGTTVTKMFKSILGNVYKRRNDAVLETIAYLRMDTTNEIGDHYEV